MGNEKKEICLEVLMIFRFFLVEIMENLGRIKKLEVKKKFSSLSCVFGSRIEKYNDGK